MPPSLCYKYSFLLDFSATLPTCLIIQGSAISNIIYLRTVVGATLSLVVFSAAAESSAGTWGCLALEGLGPSSMHDPSWWEEGSALARAVSSQGPTTCQASLTLSKGGTKGNIPLICSSCLLLVGQQLEWVH